ncbi:MAG: hypothetical protein FWC65_02415 [Treponema sp.]|nr:hypothetical protein [Treponema sp.]
MKRKLKFVIVGVLCLLPAFCVVYIVGNHINGRLFPEIRYGEFPFHFEYELDGEIFSIKDIIKIEFAGHGRGYFGFPHRVWRSTMSSGGCERRDIFQDTNVPSVLTEGQYNMAIWIWLDTGWPTYYMGDTPSRFCAPPRIMISEQVPFGTTGSVTTSTELSKAQLEKYFGIVILTWEFSNPVQNRLRIQ